MEERENAQAAKARGESREEYVRTRQLEIMDEARDGQHGNDLGKKTDAVLAAADQVFGSV